MAKKELPGSLISYNLSDWYADAARAAWKASSPDVAASELSSEKLAQRISAVLFGAAFVDASLFELARAAIQDRKDSTDPFSDWGIVEEISSFRTWKKKVKWVSYLSSPSHFWRLEIGEMPTTYRSCNRLMGLRNRLIHADLKTRESKEGVGKNGFQVETRHTARYAGNRFPGDHPDLADLDHVDELLEGAKGLIDRLASLPSLPEPGSKGPQSPWALSEVGSEPKPFWGDLLQIRWCEQTSRYVAHRWPEGATDSSSRGCAEEARCKKAAKCEWKVIADRNAPSRG